MKPTHHAKLRELLRMHPDGLTTTSISHYLDLAECAARSSLKSMADAYIDRWQPARNRSWAAVWCVVEIPEDCPRPDTPPKELVK